ncbi:hypothetical protein M9Y10_003186 [Tritrichomonas musculus]|uniref:Uncharacterized protein n=1 Tax=Tritrichomonas musculus TaxID=1915356 RepID=A0ABR2JP20_9EUKA
MFILVPTSVTVQKITSGLIKAPELRPFSSSNLTYDDLSKHEEFHEFIVNHASNLKHLKMCSKSTLRVLKLKEREYGLHLWKNRDKISAKIQLNHLLSTGSIVIDCSKQLLNRNEYQVNQLVSYCYSIFYGYMRSKTTDSLNAYFDLFQSLISQEMLERSKVDLISGFKENINT